MYISNVVYSHYPDPIFRTPTPGYASYFQEMHQFTNGYLDNTCLTQQSGYAFSELLNLGINNDKRILSVLQKADICILVNSVYEYDSCHSHIASYLKEHYLLNADLFDIAGQGSFSLISALHVLSAFFAQPNKLRGAVIGFEQRALPLRINQQQSLPTYNGLGLIEVVSRSSDKESSLKIIDSDIVSEINISKKLQQLSGKANFHYYVLSQRSNASFPNFLTNYPVSFFPISEGVLSLFMFFNKLKNQMSSSLSSFSYIILIENLISSEWGVVHCVNDRSQLS